MTHVTHTFQVQALHAKPPNLLTFVVLLGRCCCITQGVADTDCVNFCRRFVEPMGEESDHVHAQALCDALQVMMRQQLNPNDALQRLLGAGWGRMGQHECLQRSMLHPDRNESLKFTTLLHFFWGRFEPCFLAYVMVKVGRTQSTQGHREIQLGHTTWSHTPPFILGSTNPLAPSVQLPITVVYLDSHERSLEGAGGAGGGGAECEVHRFEPSSEGAGAIAAAAAGSGGSAASGRKPSVHLLYRPGHYDIACEWGAGSGGWWLGSLGSAGYPEGANAQHGCLHDMLLFFTSAARVTPPHAWIPRSCALPFAACTVIVLVMQCHQRLPPALELLDLPLFTADPVSPGVLPRKHADPKLVGNTQ